MSVHRSAFVVLSALVAACSSWSNPERVVPALPLVALPWVDVPADAGLIGVVRDTKDAPVPGAHVCAWPEAPTRLRQDDRAPRCTTAGADGAYQLAGLVPAAYFVTADAPAFKPTSAGYPVEVRAGQRRDDVGLVLRRGGAPLRGRVKDVHGAPIAGAWIGSHMFQRDALEPVAGVLSDAHGGFVLWVKNDAHNFTAGAEKLADEEAGVQRLTVEAPGYVATTLEYDTTLAPIRVTLGPASAVTGSVVEATSRVPVAGARVLAVRAEPFTESVADVAYTDAAGAFELSGLAPGRYLVRAETVNRRGEGDRVVSLGLGQTVAFLPIALTSIASVRGSVAGCSSGRILLSEFDHTGEAIGVDGEVFIPAVSPGEYTPRIRCHGFQAPDEVVQFTVRDEPLGDLRWTVGAPIVRVDTIYPEHGEIRGFVVDSTGQPVRRANVGLHRDPNGGLTPTSLPTDSNGAFAIHHVPAGEALVSAQIPNVIHWIRGPEDPGVRVKVVSGGLHERVLTVPGAARPIRGRVVQAGAPLASAVVTLRVEEFDPNMLSMGQESPIHVWGSHDELVLTDADGRFAFPTAFAGSRYALRAYPLGGGGGVRFHVEAGEDVTLEVPRTAGVSGTIAGPVPSRFVIAVVDGAGETHEQRLFHRTDGRWGFDDLSPGTYELSLVSPGMCATAKISIAAGEHRDDVELVPGKLGGLRGRVVDGKTHQPEAGAEVLVRARDPRLADFGAEFGGATVITDADGRFELLGLCLGTVDVDARTPLRSAHAAAPIEVHTVADIVLVLRATSAEEVE